MIGIAQLDLHKCEFDVCDIEYNECKTEEERQELLVMSFKESGILDLFYSEE